MNGSLEDAFAIVGMAGRFPGAPTIADFWRNLCSGVESISRFTDAELEDDFSSEIRARAEYVPARAILDNVDLFDAGFFGVTARDAELIDPQQRLFLECCSEALEDAGYDSTTFGGAIGVFAGCTINTYMLRNVLPTRAAVERFTTDYQVGSYPELLGAGQDFLATRVAYKLDLRGPAMTVQSACSTSLLAVAQACQALKLHQADMMLAGAVSISFPQKRGYLYQPGGMVSADGHCRTFDAASSGTVFGDGAGVVVLKRLVDAIADADSIYAVIRGVGITNDGSAKAGYTAPSSAGQAGAIAAAHAMAGFDPRTIHYVECHGTATPLGDPIEFAALAKVFPSTPGGAYCALGSVKTNIGHLDVAAGMSGLIKTALSIRHGKIPPVLHFTSPNPRVPIAGSPFYINAAIADWAPGDPRRAGVSSFGVGGTNVHVVLEAAPQPASRHQPADAELIILSARTPAALASMRTRLADCLRTRTDADLSDVAFTLQSGRRAFAYRIALNAADVPAAIAALESAPAPVTQTEDSPPSVAFLFPGQGAQYVNMGRDLYARIPRFRETIDRCAAILQPIGLDLCALLFPPETSDDGRETLAATELAQPALFAVEYALAQVWLSWGIVPDAMIGHSVGEFVAATIAGVFSLEHALLLVAERGRLMQALPHGAMLAVRMSETELAALLTPALSIAAANSPKLSVASGSFESIVVLERTLAERGIACRRLATSHAFHSPMMDAVLEPLLELVRTIPLNVPQLPYVSGVSGDWISAAQATSPEYWARHCRETIHFEAGVQSVVAGGANVLLEVGPGATLVTCAQQTIGSTAGVTFVSSVRDANRERNDYVVILDALGKLWCSGATPNWRAVHAPIMPRRVSLPTYPFERRRHWRAELAPPPVALPRLEATLTHITSAEPARNATRDPQLDRELIALLEDLSGETIAANDLETSFLELGFDSLFLGRFVQKLATTFGVTITFRALMTELPTIAALSAHIATTRPAPVTPVAAVEPISAAAPVLANRTTPVAAPSGSAIEAVVREQLAAMQQLMRDQLQAMQGLSGLVEATADPVDRAVPAQIAGAGAELKPSATAATNGNHSMASNGRSPRAEAALQAEVALPPTGEPPSRFEVFRPGNSGPRSEVTTAQKAHIADLVARTVQRTGRSKDLTARHRAVLADPRVAAGFRTEWKEMVYPIACDRAKGSRLWDIDGNEYIDILNGFGQTAFGHSPDFVVAAVAAQLDAGFAIGPQTPLAGEVAELFCALTGNERVTFCNTGSEAVMAALRIARTVTGRNRVVMFSGAYHGQFDEVLVKSARTSQRALPVAPGIPAESVANMVVLPYADRASLQWIREHACELAAVVVEPVQSRHPDLQPKEFLTEIRAITRASGTALVMDEVVTGFRVHPGGMQAVFNIRADLATYGKVAGGGMPIGILAGTARFMDALDGGTWQYGDDSQPEVPPTFFAGTFVRHPLVMAALLAVLRHLKHEGPALQAALSARTAGLVKRLNADLERRGIVGRIETYASLFFFTLLGEERLAGLLYYHLRLRGIYIQEGFPCFLTTAHSAADVDAIVAAFAASLDELASVGIFSGAPGNGALVDIPLTEQQTEIWLAAQLGDEASCAFNESITLRLDGKLDETAFARAWEQIIARHDALRAAFRPTGESMHVAPAATFVYARSDFAEYDIARAEAALASAIARDAQTPFDLIGGPLVRGHLLRLQAERHAFVFTAHHIICDGWSMNVILGEFTELYRAAKNGTPSDLAVPLAFSQYAQSRRARDPQEVARIETFWLDAFREPVRTLELPADRPRPAIRSFRGATASTRIDAQRYRTIKKAGARQGCTLFVTLLSAFGALIGQLAQTQDVVIGVPAAGQSLLDGDVLVGHCVDFLPIRAHWTAGSQLGELLASMKTRVLAAYEHQDFTLGTLVRKLAPARLTNRVPLAEVQFNLERLFDELALPDLRVTTAPNAKAFVNFDLFLNVIESNDGLRIDCDYNTDLFEATTIDRWLAAYGKLLDAIAADISQPVAELPIIPLAEPRELPAMVAGAALTYAQDATIDSLIAAQVAMRPDAIALTCGGSQLSYAALDARANSLAYLLRERFGGAGGRIAICLPRSLDMVVALLATLKAGFAYVPLDPTHPAARLRYILEDAAALALIADETLDRDIPPQLMPILQVGAALADADSAGLPPALGSIDPSALAYVIYTSGSTGQPKGVEVTHRSVVNFLCSMRHEPGFTADDTLLAVTTISFDIAALELYLPLTSGGIVALAEDAETRDGRRLHEAMLRSNATVLQATPATWRMLLETDFAPEPGFKMLCGGEALRRDLADRLLTLGGELWNMYGPTETTIWSACVRVAKASPITVGRPIANTVFFILDELDGPVSVGASGQLHIGGDGVARGYVNRPELTAEKFIANPFGAGRLYRTGDTARSLPNGEFEILGRLDEQVKLRGFRIELGEIEATLTRHGAVAAVTVMLQEPEQRLVAYFVERSDTPVGETELRLLAQQQLPEYMVPAIWVKLDALPLNTNGKVDRAALPAPTIGAHAFVAPQTATERILADIWADVLARERVSADDDIFALGADSIQIFQITARANRKGLSLLAKQLMKHRTIAAIAQNIDLQAQAPHNPGARLLASSTRPPARVMGERHYAPLS